MEFPPLVREETVLSPYRVQLLEVPFGYRVEVQRMDRDGWRCVQGPFAYTDLARASAGAAALANSVRARLEATPDLPYPR